MVLLCWKSVTWPVQGALWLSLIVNEYPLFCWEIYDIKPLSKDLIKIGFQYYFWFITAYHRLSPPYVLIANNLMAFDWLWQWKCSRRPLHVAKFTSMYRIIILQCLWSIELILVPLFCYILMVWFYCCQWLYLCLTSLHRRLFLMSKFTDVQFQSLFCHSWFGTFSFFKETSVCSLPYTDECF